MENRGGQPGGGRHGPYDHRDRAMHQVVRNRNYSGWYYIIFCVISGLFPFSQLLYIYIFSRA